MEQTALKAPSALKATNYAAPPKTFDPVTATAASLAQYGIPRRPDPTAEPGLRACGTGLSRESPASYKPI